MQKKNRRVKPIVADLALRQAERGAPRRELKPYQGTELVVR